jgi:hypothetical protein
MIVTPSYRLARIKSALKRSGVEGPSLYDKPPIVERRSLHYALRAPVGTREF